MNILRISSANPSNFRAKYRIVAAEFMGEEK